MSCKHVQMVCAGMALFLLGACGQKGPLYLPDKNAQQPVSASPDAARPLQKIDPEKKDEAQNPHSP